MATRKAEQEQFVAGCEYYISGNEAKDNRFVRTVHSLVEEFNGEFLLEPELDKSLYLLEITGWFKSQKDADNFQKALEAVKP